MDDSDPNKDTDLEHALKAAGLTKEQYEAEFSPCEDCKHSEFDAIVIWSRTFQLEEIQRFCGANGVWVKTHEKRDCPDFELPSKPS